MKCFIDTNVLISASLFPQGVPAQAYFKAVAFPNTVVVCDYSIDEMKSDADILITGDNHFLKSGINKPRIVTCREFLDMI
jgi:predicted nucleic acid-binding protein